MKVPPPDLARRLLDASEGILTDEPAPRLEDVARTVGASRASMYYYFAGRDDLLAYLLTAHAREGAELAQASVTDADPPPARLRAMLDALADYLGGHPGVCSGLLAATGGGRRMSEVLAVNDAWVAAPLRALVAEGVAGGVFVAGDPADPSGVVDAVNAVLGGLLLGVLGRASSGGNPSDAGFRRRLVDQIERGVTAPS